MALSIAGWAPKALAQDGNVASSPDAQMILAVAGTWTGTLDAGTDGTADITFTILQDAKKLGGSFSSDISGGASGPLKGKVSGDVVKVNLTDTESGHNCKVKVTATVSGTDMSGVFLVHGSKKHCKGRGTLDLTLQP